MSRFGLTTVLVLLSACESEETSRKGDLDIADPAGQSRTKADGGRNGDFNYCKSPGTTCAAGEGDCDNDGHCDDDLVCGLNNGGQFEMHWSRDVCVVKTCTDRIQNNGETGIDIGGDCGGACGGANGDNEGFCTVGCPCEEGEGDCDSDAECAPGLTCVNNQGGRFGNGLDPLDDVCIGALGIGQLSVGDVIITEIMNNPDAVSDGAGEWFELFNTTRLPIDLNGMQFRRTGAGISFTINTAKIIAPGGYLVLARNGNPALNGGVDDDFRYVSNFQLGNTSDSIVLDNGPLEIDRVVYNATFPSTAGSSMQLSRTRYDSVDNNSSANWCVSVATYGAGDLGTPGSDNRVCP